MNHITSKHIRTRQANSRLNGQRIPSSIPTGFYLVQYVVHIGLMPRHTHILRPLLMPHYLLTPDPNPEQDCEKIAEV